ncbi:MAG: efflux RND transporter permease subunit [Candidatus Altimarinota bacterium]
MSRVWIFFIEHFRFTYVVLTTIILSGLVSVYLMPKESAPEVVVPIGVVTTIYPGASALDVEELVTNEIEDEISDLDDLDTYTSTSSEGVSSIVVEFDPNSQIDDRIRALKDAVDDALPDLPDEVDRSIVKQITLADQPMMIFSFSVDVPERELKSIAETVQDELEKLPGLSEAKLVGVRDREVQVTVDQAQLELYGLSLGEVVRAIQSNDAQLPVGSIEQQQKKYTVRFEGGLEDPSLIADIPIRSLGTQPVYVSDVAQVTDGFQEQSSLSRLSLDGEMAEGSISVEIFKRERADIVTLTNAIYATLDELKKGVLRDAEVFISFDEGERIQDDLFGLLNNGWQTILIVFLLLYLFLGWREALLAGISVPVTFLITFIFLSILGFTINFLTLFSLILALGILVDSTIVIVEGMHSYVQEGKSPIEAAKATIHEYQWPVISGIMTTVAAFFPMTFASGVTGQYIRTIPVTVSIVLLASLFVALTIIPVIGSRYLKKSHNDSAHRSEDKTISSVEYIHRLGVWYEKRLRKILSDTKHHWQVFAFLVIAFVISMSLPFVGILDAVLFPVVDEDRFTLQVEAPLGTVLEKTDEVVKKVEKMLYEDPRIVSFVTSVGSAGGQSTGGSSSSSHIARISVSLVEEDERVEKSYDILEEYRARFRQITDANITLSQEAAGPPTGSPIEITFSGENLDELDRLLRSGEEILATTEGTTSIERSIKDAPFEFSFRVDRAKAAQVGVTPLDIADFIRTSLFGRDATTLKLQGNDVDVMVQLNLNPFSNHPHETQKTSINVLENLSIPTPQGSVPLMALLDTSLRSSVYSIQHDDGERISKLTSDIRPGFTTQSVLEAFDQRVSELKMPPDYRIRYGGEAEDVAESFNSMYNAMIIGVFLIAAILVLQFNSFKQPFFILVSLPFALIGVFPGLAISQQPLSFPAFIGIVALSGIVVNDAIIMIDQINNNIKKHLPFQDAVVKATLSRVQPIILTTVTTVAGILPLTLSDPIWGPLGFAIIFGLTFSTVLTLLVVPLLYYRYGEHTVQL